MVAAGEQRWLKHLNGFNSFTKRLETPNFVLSKVYSRASGLELRKLKYLGARSWPVNHSLN